MRKEIEAGGDRKVEITKIPSRSGFANNATASIFGNFFPPAMAVISGPILAHGLGVGGRGLSAAATAPLLLVTIMATFGIPDTVTFVIARDPRLHRWVLKRGLAITFALALVTTAATILLRNEISGDREAISQRILLASLFITPTLLLNVVRGAAGGGHFWRRVAFERAVGATARVIVLSGLLVSNHLNVTSATIVIAGSPLVGAFAYIGMGRHFPTSVVPSAAWLEAVQPARFASRLWIGSISGALLLRLDQTLMTPLATSYQLGLYVVAANLSEVALVVNAALRDVMFAAESSEQKEQLLGQAARISTAIAAAGAVGIGVLLEFTISALFGSGFRHALPALMILLVAVVGGNPGSIAGAGLSARQKPGLRSLALSVACVTNVVLIFLLVPRYGAVGAAEASLVGNVIASNLVIYFLWRRFGVSPRDFYGVRKADISMVMAQTRRLLRL